MNARTWIAVLVAALPLALPAGRAAAVDTQFIFGFTIGADVGKVGEKEIEHQTIGRFGKRDGSYAAFADQLRVEFTPIENFRLEIGAPVAYHDIAGVTGLDDRRQGAFDGLVAEFRYRLLDRERAPFALTVGAEPHWSRVEETSGKPVDNYGSELSIAADRELVENRVYGALNLLYDPELTRSRVTGQWQREASLGVSVSVATQVQPGIFFGAEARYLRKYEGLGLDPFAGEALYVGPTMFAKLSKAWAISAAWNIQVAGRAVGDPGLLDLTNFERHQATLRLEHNF